MHASKAWQSAEAWSQAMLVGLQVDLPDPERPTYGVVRCVNYTAHLGRWAIPVTREDLDSEKVCGIDGCF